MQRRVRESWRWGAAAVLVAGLAGVARADDAPPPPRPDYDLALPVPDDQLRTLAPDRPSQASGPITVDAGHFQIETDLFNGVYDRWSAGAVTTDGFTTADPVVKLGLTDTVDAELGVGGFVFVRTIDRRTGHATDLDGFGDLDAKLKVNLWGNDGGDTAMALLPYVRLPTGSAGIGDGAVEGGLLVPFTDSLTPSLTLTLQGEIDVLKSPDGRGRYANLVAIVNLGYTVTDGLTAYGEVFAELPASGAAPDVYTGDVAVAYLLTPDTQIDLGVNLGLNRAAPDANPYLGLTRRF